MSYKYVIGIIISSISRGSFYAMQAQTLTSFTFPENASPQHIGKLDVENLLLRSFMMTADGDGMHYAEICAADGAINFTKETDDLNLFYQLEDRYSCILEDDFI